jgi:hypothetical protein
MKCYIFIAWFCVVTLGCSSPGEGQFLRPDDKVLAKIQEDTVLPLEIDLSGNSGRREFMQGWLKQHVFTSASPLVLTEKLDAKMALTHYRIELDDSYPTSLPHLYTVVYLEKEKLCFLLPIDLNYSSILDGTLMLGGFYDRRENEYYRMYSFGKRVLHVAMDTQKATGEEPAKVGYFRDDECIDYVPDRLLFQQRENEIHFVGAIDYYCDGGKDRDVNADVKPIRSERVDMAFRCEQGVWRTVRAK